MATCRPLAAAEQGRWEGEWRPRAAGPLQGPKQGSASMLSMFRFIQVTGPYSAHHHAQPQRPEGAEPLVENHARPWRAPAGLAGGGDSRGRAPEPTSAGDE